MKKEYIKMIVVLTVIAMVCGFLLAAVKNITQSRIEEQILVNVKGPALENVLNLATNNPIDDRLEVEIDEVIYTVFPGKKGKNLWAIAFESTGTGFGGSIGVMLGVDMEKSILAGIGILTHQETPGLGSRISETSFTVIIPSFLSGNAYLKAFVIISFNINPQGMAVSRVIDISSISISITIFK